MRDRLPWILAGLVCAPIVLLLGPFVVLFAVLFYGSMTITFAVLAPPAFALRAAGQWLQRDLSFLSTPVLIMWLFGLTSVISLMPGNGAGVDIHEGHGPHEFEEINREAEGAPGLTRLLLQFSQPSV